MLTRLVKQPAASWLLALLMLLGCGFAMAQAEPTLNQVFEAARAGKLDQAQTMMQQVITAHPNSAKAHFVHAELYAQQGRIDAARASLATAERLAPGLPFASAESVSGLRARLTGSGLNGLSGSAPNALGRTQSSGTTAPRAAPAPATSQGSSFGFFWPVVLIGGALALALVMFRRRRSAATTQAYPVGSNGQQGYGSVAATAGTPGTPQPYAQPGQQPYGQPYPQQPAGSGLGSRIAGGLATGAAIGAGMMAAQAIGRSMTGHDAPRAGQTDNLSSGGGNNDGIPSGDLGGQNFGVSDTSSWDDSSAGSLSSSDVGGGDWDN